MTSRITLAFLATMISAVTATALAGDQRVLHADSIQLQNGTNYVQLQAPTLGSNVTFTFPSVSLAFPTSSGTANYVMRTDGAGVTTWVDALTTLHVSDATHSGYLSSTDWATFNSGVAGSVPTTRTVSTTAPLQGGGDLSANRTLSITQAATAANGYLGSTDWNTFNNKVATSEAISTTAPLTGGGDLSAPRTFAITQSGAGGNGYLSSTDWTTFNTIAKVMTTAGDVIYGGVTGAPTRLADGTSVQVLHSGTTPSWSAVSLSADVTGTLPTGNMAGPAATATSGFLSSTDWNTFNTKVGTTRAINTTAPITGGGDLSADRTIAITQAATAANGYLSSTDWNTFNGKLTSPLTTKGDIQTYSSAPARLAVGGNGTVLSADSAQTTGLAWISVLSNPMTTTGDIIYSSDNSGTAARLAIGASTTVLHGGTTPAYSAVVSGDITSLAASKLTTGTLSGAIIDASGSTSGIAVEQARTSPAAGDSQTVYSGTYTPTFTRTSDTFTTQLFNWFRVGNKVHVWGYSLTGGGGGTNSTTITLPIAPSAFSGTAAIRQSQATGACFTDSSTAIDIAGTASSTTTVTLNNIGNAATGLRCVFDYRL